MAGGRDYSRVGEGEGVDFFWLRRISKPFGYWGDSPYPLSRKNLAYNVECMK